MLHFRASKTKARVFWLLAASTSLHMLAFLPLRAPAPLPPPRDPKPILVKILAQDPKPSPHNAKKAATATPASHQAPKHHGASHNQIPASTKMAAATVPNPGRYEDYLPGQSYALSYSDASSGPGGSARATRGGNGADAAANATFTALTRNVAPLTHFAREFGEQVSLPDALVKLTSSGHARLRFNKQAATQWTVALADGDPYFRAALFDALQALSPLSLAIAYLEQAGISTVKIAAEYTCVSPFDTRTPPLTVRVEGDAVFLHFTRKVADAKWQIIMPVDPTTIGLNIIGLTSYLIEKSPGYYESDAGLKRLRLSPAFSRPFTLGR